MILEKSDYARIAAEVRAELIPILKEELRIELSDMIHQHHAAYGRRDNGPRLLRLPEVCDKVGYKSTKIRDLTRTGLFPQPVKLGPKMTAWREHEVNEWIQQHAA